MSGKVDKSPVKISRMFDSIAKQYDFLNDVTSLGFVRFWRRKVRVAISVKPGERVLDLAAGTGTSTNALYSPDVEIVACDLSPEMIRCGRRKFPHLDFVQGNATCLPFADNSFDVVTISFGLRNVDDTLLALREMFRVARPGGRIVVCEFSTPSNGVISLLYRFYNSVVLKRLIRGLTKNFKAYEYLNDSIQQWYTQDQLLSLLRSAGWERVGYKDLTFGVVAVHKGFKPKA